MKFRKTLALIIAFQAITIAKAQVDTNQISYPPAPIPIEIVGGEKSSTYQSVISRQLFNSNFNFYNLTYLEVDYDETTPHYYYVQSIVSYSLPKGFNVGLGANLQTYNAFKPLVAISYMYFTENIGLVIQPSYEIHEDGLFELYAMFEWTAKNEKKVQPYFKLSAYSSWEEEHVYSYQFWRAGLNYKGFRFGPALNAQYYGTDFSSVLNFGGFISVLL